MYLKKIHVLFIAVLILIAITFSNTNIIIKEYKLHNIYGAPAGSRINLIDYYMGSIIDKIKHVFVLNSNNGLTIEEFMIPERSKENLLSDFPLNIKKWQTAYYKYPDNNFRKVKIKLRGDNPNGWAREKKTFRIKTKKNRLIGNKRVINYHLPQDENIVGTYLSYYIGKKINLMTPDIELIEARINGEPSGIYFKNSQIDEIFLRRNNKMPVNIYKGEQYHTERALERSNDLFNNPSLWSKIAIFNQRSENDYTDLERFINLIRKAETSDEYYNELKIVADINEWATFSAYQTIIQSWHNNRNHNMRLISDLWSGTVTPIVHDPGSSLVEEQNKNLVYDNDPHSLYEIYNQSSEFLSLKYNYLYDFLTKDVLLQTADHAQELINKLSNSWHREVNRTQFRLTNSKVKRKTDQKSMESIWNKIPEIIENRNKILLDKLKEKPNATWSKTKNIISLVTKSLVPVSDVTITTKNLNSPQINVYFDRDSNGILSDQDMLIPSKREKNKIILSAEFITNRNSVKNYFNEPSIVEINNTKFNLIFSLPIDVVRVEARNALTQNKFIITQNDSDGQTPSRLNYPLIKNQLKAEQWAGVKTMEGTNIINYPVKVAPGTSILMKEGANLIFRDRIIVNGTKKNPVEIKSANSTKIWGTLALQGKKTSGSIFSYVSISGGSGYETANNKYSGMFSIHDTSEIVLENILLEKNKIYDDTLHFVYGNNVKINNCYINNAFADAIDIDISRVLINGCKIENSRNDGIDTMNSLVKINKSFIKGSGDKGISIGENSNVLIMMTELENNHIGVQTKDNSISLIAQSVLKNNLLQSDAYQKNWQYGGGGNVEIFNTNITPIIDKISNDKKSNTYFYDNKYDSKTIGKSLNTYFIHENSHIFQNYNPYYVNFDQHLSEWNKKIIQ